MDTRFWHILQVASGFEAEVAKSFNAPAYVPRKAISYYNRRMRIKVRRVVPALPSYVFVRAEAPQTVVYPPRPEIFGFMRNGNRTFSVLHPKSFEILLRLEQELLGVTDAQLGLQNDTIMEEIRGDKLLAELVEASFCAEVPTEQLAVA